MPKQFLSALYALNDPEARKKFNNQYGTTGEAPSRPSSPSLHGNGRKGLAQRGMRGGQNKTRHARKSRKVSRRSKWTMNRRRHA